MAGLFDDLIPGAKPAKQDFGLFADLVPPPPMPRSLAAVANDTVIETGNAIAGAVGSIGNIIAPGNRVSQYIDENIVKAGREAQSDVVKASNRQYEQDIAQADGVMGELGAVARKIARDPLLTAAQAAGSFVVPGAAVKGAGALARGLGAGAAGASTAGMAGGATTGAALSGGDAAGTAYELSIKAGASEQDAQAAARQASAIPAVVGGLGGVIGAERLLAGAGGVSGGAIARALKTAGIEGLQEGFEEGVTQYEGQRAAMPFDPSIDPSKGVAAAAGMGAALGGVTGAGVSLMAGGPSPNVQATIAAQREAEADQALAQIGGATNVDEAIDSAMRAVPPVDGLVPTIDENAAMGRMEAQAAEDQKGLKQYGGGQGFTAPPVAGTRAAAAPAVAGGQAAPAQASIADSPFADRVMTLREQLQDDNVREQVRAAFGDEAMREALYFASSADNPNLDLPEKTRERMLSMAETLVSRAVARPVASQPQMSGQAPAPRLEAPAAVPEVPRIGLDTAQTGVMRVNAAGQAAPETRADVISAADRERAAAVRPDGMTGTFPQGFPDRPGVMVGDGQLQAATFPVRQPAPPPAAEAPRALPAPAGDREWAAFPPESGTLGVPRAEMPQVKAEHRGALVNYLTARGITHEQEADVDPRTLKATQAEYSLPKVQKALDYEGGDRAILASADGHVLDGHHQWIAAMTADKPVRVIRLNAPIAELMNQVREFPSALTSEGAPNGASPAATGRTDAGSAGRGDQPGGSMEPARLLAEGARGRDGDRGAGEPVSGGGADSAAAVAGADDAVEPSRSQRMREAGYTRRPTWRALPSEEAEGAQEPKTLRERAQAMKDRAKAKKADAPAPQPTATPEAREAAAPVAAPARTAEADVSRAGSAGVEADGLKARAERMKARRRAAEAPAPAKIEDFGEKLAGARKDYAEKLTDALAVDVAAEPLSKSWPEPDYDKLLSGGADPKVVALVRAMRDEVPTKPSKAWKLRGWVEKVNNLRAFSSSLLDGSQDYSKLRTQMEATSQLRDNVLGRADLYEALGHQRSLKGVVFAKREYFLFAGEKNVTKWVIEQEAKATAFGNWPRQLAVADTKDAALSQFKEKLSTLDLGKQAKGSTSFDIYTKRGQRGVVFIGKKIGREHIDLKKFDSVAQARAFLADNKAELEQALERYKVTPFERNAENRPRVGEDHRNGAPVTPEAFAETFGFRGVQFGNYVEQGRRQSDLNQAFDALMDMAAVMGVPPRALSLNGRLGLAFGARGKGGKNAPGAHYEPGSVVINLTKGGGPGSLGHEWWHAVDNYFGREFGDGGYATGGARVDRLRQAMQEAFAEVRTATQAPSLVRRALELDKRRSKPYWSTPIELSARAFESYVIAKLQDQGVSNDYLANVIDEKVWNVDEDMRAEALGTEVVGTYPYPGQAELPAVRAAFDEFFRTVEVREDEDGNPSILADLNRIGTTIAAQGYEKSEVPRVQAARKLQGLLAKRDAGEISDGMFETSLRLLAQRMTEASDTKQANRWMAERERGADIVREKLIRARRQGDMEPEAVDFALWAIDQNPAIAERLGISVRAPKDGVAAGDYNPAAEIIRLFKGTQSTDTAVHEILHHAERMMPADMQEAIRKEWAATLAKAMRKATPEQAAALQNVIPAMAGDKASYKALVKAIQEGPLNYADHYQLTNPSEFWAVNATKLMAARFAARDSVWQRVATWFRETVQQARALVGMRSTAPLIRALDAVLEGNGSRQSKEMLSAKGPAGGNFQNIAATLGDRLNDAKSIKLPAGYVVGDFFSNNGKVSWWHKTVGTMHNLAERSPPFKRVYDAAQQFLNDVSSYAAEAADLAPKILPKMESWRDLAKSPLSAEDTKALSAPVFEGTLVWTRDGSGKPVRVKDLEAKAVGMDAEAKAQQMLREGKVTEAELKRWQGLPLDSYEGAVRNRYDSAYLRGGLVWTDAELKAQFGLTPAQIGLYREFRAATDKSLNDLGTSDMIRYAGKDAAAVRQQMLDAPTADAAGMILRDHLFALAEQNPDRAEVLNDTANKIVEKADKVKDLIAKGYAPLSRFGSYFVSVKKGDEQVFFSLYESKLAAAGAARRMRVEYPDAHVSNGTMPQEAFKMFAGVSPETLELFGEMLGLEEGADGASNQAFQQYLKVAKNNRSAMKRLIERKGIAGFSEDAGRVLAGFVYSNARQTSQNLNAGEMTQSLLAIKENERTEGELYDTASKLLDYVRNPQEEAGGFRGLLFAQYLGGNIASAIVNATQPLMVTFPYLSQFGGIAKAASRMTQATKDALAKTTGSEELDAALKKAEADGIVSPQEVHHLMAQAAGRAQLQAGDGTALGNAAATARNHLAKFSLAWGKVFSVAEQYNRRVTFIAAYRTAVDQGIADPFAFAERVVTETQFNYTKAGRPRWARGALPSVLFTFKTYSISYVELLHRMYTRGGPEGKRAALLALAMLFLVSGLDGLPGTDDVEDVLDGLLQRMGYNFSTKQAKREFLVGVLGEDGAQFVTKGISGLPGVPIDVSGRMGLGNLIPGTGFLTKKQDYSRDMTEMFGPAGDFAKRAGQSAAALVDGEPVKAIMGMAPTAARNLQKAFDMHANGMYRDDRGRKVIDTDATEAAFKAIGFQPNSVARVQESTSTVQQLVGLNKMMESEIAQKWARGVFEKDQDLVQEARAMLAEWNENNPSSPIRINSMQIYKRVKQMSLSKAERLAKTAPAEIRASVRAELASR